MPGSLNPRDLRGGGMLDDADVTVKQARFVKYDYAGKSDRPVLALALELVATDNPVSHYEYYSAGDLQFFIPTADGKGYEPVGDKTGIRKDCNAATFLASLIAAGFPENKLGDDVSVLDGLKLHVTRQAQKQRTFRDGRKPAKEATILLVTKILGGVVAAAPAGVTGDVEAKVVAAVAALLAKGPQPLQRLATEVFKGLMTSEPAVAKDAIKIITPTWLASEGKPWTVAGDMVVGG